MRPSRWGRGLNSRWPPAPSLPPSLPPSEQSEWDGQLRRCVAARRETWARSRAQMEMSMRKSKGRACLRVTARCAPSPKSARSCQRALCPQGGRYLRLRQNGSPASPAAERRGGRGGGRAAAVAPRPRICLPWRARKSRRRRRRAAGGARQVSGGRESRRSSYECSTPSHDRTGRGEAPRAPQTRPRQQHVLSTKERKETSPRARCAAY